MNANSLFLLLAFFGAFAATCALVPPFIRLAFASGVVDKPAHRKIHGRSVAYLGGAALFGGAMAALGALTLGSGGPGLNSTALWILGCTLWAVSVGLLDDRFNLPARYKLAGQLAGVGAFAAFNFRFEILDLPWMPAIPLYYLSLPLTIFWMLAVLNSMNLIDGLDGLSGSVAAAALLLLAAAAAAMGDATLCLLSLAVLGSTLGFLCFNWSPARIYLGDAGSCGLGMFLATSLLSLGRNQVESGQPFINHLPLLTLFVAYPALDVTLAVLRRILRGRPIGAADKGHLHHRLRNLGWSAPAVTVLGAGFSLACGLAALAALRGQDQLKVQLLLGAGGLLALGLPALGCLDFLHLRRLRHVRPHFLIANHFINMQMIKLELAQYLNEVLTLCNQTCVEFGVEQYSVMLSGAEQGKGEWRYSWRKPRQQHRDYLTFFDTHEPLSVPGFSDEAQLPAGRGWVRWGFEPHPVEEDIDVEYYVLVSDFMKKALIRAHALCSIYGEATESSSVIAGGATVNSSLLKRRTAVKRLEWLAPGTTF